MYKLSGCDNRPKLPSKLAFSTLHPYRRVHYYCYYCSSVKPYFPFALRRCGFIHGRAGERINIIMCVRPTVPVRAHCFRVRINPPPPGGNRTKYLRIPLYRVKYLYIRARMGYYTFGCTPVASNSSTNPD